MAVFQRTFRFTTKGNTDIVDITARVEQIVAENGADEGIVNVSGLGSTLAVTTIEFEPGAVADLKRALDQIAPADDRYAHNARWGDHNGYAHLRSALLGTAKSFPVSAGALHLGTWQQIVVCDFDDRPRDREITVTVVS
jgi:secondary thiamine-phosphate synthase enzyme